MAAKKTAGNPVPTQKKADEIREEAATTVAEPAVKPEEKPASAKAAPAAPDAPFPTQADLDAMRAGTYNNRELKTR